ncbi:two-component system response regulator YesN [Fontibacillus phaseoli]|uniref:Two-component system response regulator YesN n=1 Tax=Fontibacillus phaseoli TaxID=1416533 RepID=A0A369B5J0_9BACL|nr:response regulator [Fontibacillus phaseoli]RCX16753.1 two-component system response regulator YesN [Fontibacillus phaseoli]
MRFKVLLIDDEPGALEGMQLWIDWERLGFEIVGTCGNGAEGLRSIGELNPDLVVTDVNMPLMDGLEMIESWQKNGDRKISFVIVSGYSEFDYARRAMRYGIAHYLLKPIEQDEAEKELQAAYQELLQEYEEQHISQIASYEETVSLLKKAAMEEPQSVADLTVLERLSASREAWNFCLVQCDPPLYAPSRETAASLVRNQDAMYLVDLEMHCFGIVYGYTPARGDENEAWAILTQLSQSYSPYRVFMSTGAGETSLVGLNSCYKTARAAILHNFYDSGYAEIKKYESVGNHVFQYHYDQIRLMDGIIGAMNLLDISGLEDAVSSAVQSFREMAMAPEIVKKIVIHLMYKIMEYLQGLDGEPASSLLEKYNSLLSGLSDAVLLLEDLMGYLLHCGKDTIDLMLQEQMRRSQGIIQEINEYIRGHYREALTIKMLSEIFYLHPVYLGQLLLRKNGISFNELVHNLRIEEAVALLQQNRLKNSEIAEQLGYSNYGQFLKQFEKRMGVSPNEFKNRI